MEGFLHHMAPQFLHPALQTFGCGAFRPIAAAGAFHPLYPTKAFARHLGEQYALGQSVGQALRVREVDAGTPPLYRGAGGAFSGTPRDDSSSPGSAASASPRAPCKEEESGPPRCSEEHHEFLHGSRPTDSERKLSCGVCGARLGPGVAQAHFLQELQHLYSLSTPRDLPPSLHHQDEDARWETYQRIRANRQRRLRQRTRKRHHTVESLLGLGYEPEEAPRRPAYEDTEDEPVDVEGDELGWPDVAVPSHTQVSEKDHNVESDNNMKIQLSYTEDLEISSTNDTVQSPERVRIETPKSQAQDCTATNLSTATTAAGIGEGTGERASECVSTNNRRHKSSTSLTSSLFQYSRSERKLDTVDKNTFSASDIVDNKLLKAELRCGEFKEKLEAVRNLKKAKKKRRTGSLTHLTRVPETVTTKDLAAKKSSGHKVHAPSKKDNKSNVFQTSETKKNIANRKQSIALTTSKTRMRKASEGAGAANQIFRRKYVDPDELQQRAMVRQIQEMNSDEGQVMQNDAPEVRMTRPKKIRPPKKISRYMTRLKEHDDIEEEDKNTERPPNEFNQQNTLSKETSQSGRKMGRNEKAILANAAHVAKQDELDEALLNEDVNLLDTTDQTIGESFDEQQHCEQQHRPIVELYHSKAPGSCKVASEPRSTGHSTDMRRNYRSKRSETKTGCEHLESKYQTHGQFESVSITKSRKYSEKPKTAQVYNLDTDLTEAEDEISPSNNIKIPTLPLKKYRHDHWNNWSRHITPAKFTFSSLLAPHRYELPTIASKMKQVDNRMLIRKSDIPFVPAKSTSPSHNIGMNLQKLLADIKINSSVTGIPLSLALRMGLKLGQLKARSRRKYHRLVTKQRSSEMGVLRVGARSVPLQRTMSFGRLLRLCGDGDGIVPRYLRSQGRANFYHSSFTLNQEMDSPWSRYTEKSEPAPITEKIVADSNIEQYNAPREMGQLDKKKSKKLIRKLSKEYMRRQAMQEAEEYINKMKVAGTYAVSNG